MTTIRVNRMTSSSEDDGFGEVSGDLLWTFQTN